MKMAHKLMVLVGSVIVVAVVIVLIQLRTSAQLADGGDGLLQCDTNVCQSAVNCEGPGPCTTSPVCSQAECKDCTQCQGGGGVAAGQNKSCAGILGYLRFDRRLRLQPEHQLKLDNLVKDTLKNTQQKVNEVMNDTLLVADMENVFQAQRETDLAKVQNELDAVTVNGVIDPTMGRQILSKEYMAAVYIPFETSRQILINTRKAIPLDLSLCDHGGGGGGKCDSIDRCEIPICKVPPCDVPSDGICSCDPNGNFCPNDPDCQGGGGGGAGYCDWERDGCDGSEFHLECYALWTEQECCSHYGLTWCTQGGGSGGGCKDNGICEKSCPNDRDCGFSRDPPGKIANLENTLIRSEFTKYFDEHVTAAVEPVLEIQSANVTATETVTIENAITTTEQQVNNAVDDTYTAGQIVGAIITPAAEAVIQVMSAMTDSAAQDTVIEAVAQNAGLQVAAKVKNANANATPAEVLAAVEAAENAVKAAGNSAKTK